MAQDKRIEAYRRRLWRRGYKQVSIGRSLGDRYVVSAVEPLSGLRVTKVLRLSEFETEVKA